MHEAAKQVAAAGNGLLPATAAELRELPGIGAYTAAAIASIAHGEAVAVVDGNVERVLCRLEGWEGGASRRRSIDELANRLISPDRPGDFNQALMELGATVCTPRNPQCLVCPIAAGCATLGEHKTQPRPKMQRREIAHALVLRSVRRGRGAKLREEAVLLERRPAHVTVMPGLWQLPALADAEVPESELRMTVRHAIMQVNYVVRIRSIEERDLDRLAAKNGERRWAPLAEAGGMALTGLTRKVLIRARLLHREATAAHAAN
jgi:A/G-specific adenine glycosylase